MLKVFILFVLFSTVLAQFRGIREKLPEAEEKCRRDHHVTRFEINELRTEIVSDTERIGRKYMCYVKCVMDELVIKYENDIPSFRQIAQVYNRTDDRAISLAAYCVVKHFTITDKCEKQFKTIACVALQYHKDENNHHDG